MQAEGHAHHLVEIINRYRHLNDLALRATCRSGNNHQFNTRFDIYRIRLCTSGISIGHSYNIGTGTEATHKRAVGAIVPHVSEHTGTTGCHGRNRSVISSKECFCSTGSRQHEPGIVAQGHLDIYRTGILISVRVYHGKRNRLYTQVATIERGNIQEHGVDAAIVRTSQVDVVGLDRSRTISTQ